MFYIYFIDYNIEERKDSYQAWKTLTANAIKTILKGINMINPYLSVEHKNSERQELETINSQANHNSDLYSEGDFNIVRGLDPSSRTKTLLLVRLLR